MSSWLPFEGSKFWPIGTFVERSIAAKILELEVHVNVDCNINKQNDCEDYISRYPAQCQSIPKRSYRKITVCARINIRLIIDEGKGCHEKWK